MGKESAMKNPLTDESVIAYLKANPEFFDTHPDALPPLDQGKGVVDFQQRMLERLKTDKSKAQRLQKELIENVRANMNNQGRIQTAVLTTSKEIPFINQAGIRFAKTGTVTKWLSTGDALLQDNINGHEELFGPGAGLVKSHALVRLEISADTPAGIIAFGSRDPEAFHPNHAVDQIGFLAQVVERCFRIWLGIQA